MLRHASIASVLVLVASLGGTFACTGGAASTFDEQRAQYQSCVDSVPKPAALSLEEASTKGPFSAELVRTDRSSVESALHASLKKEMAASVEQSRYAAIVNLRCSKYYPKDSRGAADAAAAPSYASGGEDEAAGGGAQQVSTTNNQIAGVDEADFIKNDNTYIYVANGSHFRIVQAWPAETAHEIASVEVPGTAKKMFVYGDRALVYSSVPRQTTGSQGGSNGGAGYSPGYYGAGQCTYGYDCAFTGDGTATAVTIFDIANRAAPKPIRTIETSSSLLAARRIGSVIHTVFAELPFGDSYWQSYPSGQTSSWKDEAALNAAFDALLAENGEQIEAIKADDVLPRLSDDRAPAPASALYQSGMPDGAAFTTLLSFDLAKDSGAAKAVTVISRPGAVFSSADSLYMAVPHQRIAGWGWYDGAGYDELSTVHKFSLGQSALESSYAGSGLVQGRVLNQFSMDEKDQKLRIATTTGHVPSPNVKSTLSVLEDQGGHLGVIGEIDDIAPGEDIRSVRFDGDRGYVVTFKKTDPLFVFDLSDPKAPKTIGELKIPGFSVYMHLMDPTHLLTIGYDASDQGDFAWFTGVILQIFDVSNPTSPTLTHKETIGTRGSSSEALADHLAFNYFAPKNLLAIPMTICEGGDRNGGYGTDMTFSGLMVYDVTTSAGFSLKGKVAHPNTTAQDGSYSYDSVGCSNWWANATSEVKRSVIMDDYVFSISSKRIKVNALSNLSNDLVEIPIADATTTAEEQRY